MHIERMTARGWRNLEPLSFRPGPGLTVVHGDNGQGKTNLIEAAYFSLAFRSFRTLATADLLRWEGTAAKIETEFVASGLERALTAELSPERKTFKLDGKVVRRDHPALAGAAVVLFVPQDLLLPRAAPAERRRFVDMAVFAQNRGYFREAADFLRVVKSRNALLRRHEAEDSLLDTYDDEMARTGARILVRRRELVARLAPRVETLFRQVHADLPVTIRYVSHESLAAVAGEDDLRQALAEGLAKRRALDLRRGFSGFGPQTDDIEIGLGGHLARRHGSQGQLRSLVLALKLAELGSLTESLGEPPLLLLDDVASELDEERRRRLFTTVVGLGVPTIVTTTEPGLVPELTGRRTFRVDAGRVAEE
jgi:DNA replication and repair protein RecF